MVETRLGKVCKLLNRYKTKYLVVGAEAAILHGLRRTTEDLDIFIPKDLDNIRRVLQALGNLTWGIAKEIDEERLLTHPFTIIGDQPRVDVLTALRGIKFEEAWKNRRRQVVEGVSVPFLSFSHLIRSKDTGRVKDAEDIRFLRRLRRKQNKR